MKLHHVSMGPTGGLPILLVHGLFGQGRNLAAQARRLARHRHVILPDLRNHGDSPHDGHSDYPSLADDLARLIEDHGGQADLAGHSMGGKAAMALALTRPELLRKLVVMDIAPIPYSRGQSALIDAMEGLVVSDLTRRSEADSRLARHVDDPGIRAFLLQSLDLKARPPQWRLNLKTLRAQMETLIGWPDDLPKGHFEGPVLEMAGEQSDYVTPEGQQALREWFPQARIMRIKGAGHWLHADVPEVVTDILTQFLGDG